MHDDSDVFNLLVLLLKLLWVEVFELKWSIQTDRDSMWKSEIGATAMGKNYIQNIGVCSYLFDTFEQELLVSSLIGLVDKFSHFSIADNSQWLFERIDDIPESSFSFKCRPKRIFINGYFNKSCAAIFSLFFTEWEKKRKQLNQQKKVQIEILGNPRLLCTHQWHLAIITISLFI